MNMKTILSIGRTYIALLLCLACVWGIAAAGCAVERDEHDGHDHAAHAGEDASEQEGHAHAAHAEQDEEDHSDHDHSAHAEAGEVVDASTEDATYLIGLGKAVPAGKAPKAESREADAEESISKRMK